MVAFLRRCLLFRQEKSWEETKEFVSSVPNEQVTAADLIRDPGCCLSAVSVKGTLRQNFKELGGAKVDDESALIDQFLGYTTG